MNHRLQAIRRANRGSVLCVACLYRAHLAASLFQRAVVNPIVHLAEIARIVSRDKTIPFGQMQTGNRDEPGILIQAFNEMLSQIEERERALQKAHDELEQACPGTHWAARLCQQRTGVTEPGSTTRDSTKKPVPRQHEPRASDSAQCDHWLF